MKIKRYFAPDLRQAIRMVRESQGPDAVILSNRRVDGGVEIVAAVDYDEEVVKDLAHQAPVEAAPHPQEETSRQAPESGLAANLSANRPAQTEKQSETANSLAALLAQAAPTKQGQGKVSDPDDQQSFDEAYRFESAMPKSGNESAIVWSQEPVLKAMREEMQTLRSMLEGQLAGLAWHEERKTHPLRTNLLERLIQLGLDGELCRELAEQVEYSDDPEQNWKQALGLFTRQILVTNDDILTHGGVIAMVGPTGVGKTTTVAKLAARYAMRHGPDKVALVTTDSYRIGAHNQLRTFARILSVPVHVANDSDELRKLLDSLSDKTLVLIDTAGMSQRDMRLTEQFAMLRRGAPRIKIYAVLSTTTQRAALDETLRTLGRVELEGCILTKVDESAALGEALSVVSRHHLPIAYISNGQRVPEDIEPAQINSLVSKSLALMRHFDYEIPDDETMAITFANNSGVPNG